MTSYPFPSTPEVRSMAGASPLGLWPTTTRRTPPRCKKGTWRKWKQKTMDPKTLRPQEWKNKPTTPKDLNRSRFFSQNKNWNTLESSHSKKGGAKLLLSKVPPSDSMDQSILQNLRIDPCKTRGTLKRRWGKFSPSSRAQLSMLVVELSFNPFEINMHKCKWGNPSSPIFGVKIPKTHLKPPLPGGLLINFYGIFWNWTGERSGMNLTITTHSYLHTTQRRNWAKEMFNIKLKGIISLMFLRKSIWDLEYEEFLLPSWDWGICSAA